MNVVVRVHASGAFREVEEPLPAESLGHLTHGAAPCSWGHAPAMLVSLASLVPNHTIAAHLVATTAITGRAVRFRAMRHRAANASLIAIVVHESEKWLPFLPSFPVNLAIVKSKKLKR